MSEMIERMARALMRSRFRSGPPAQINAERSKGGIMLPLAIQQDQWEKFLRDARTDLAATVAEPLPDDMVTAAQSVLPDMSRWDLQIVWQAVVDEALK